MSSSSFLASFLAFADKLKFRSLFLLVSTLFIIDLLVPDVIPLIDEIILGLLTVILANWKRERKLPNQHGEVIEGEVIDDDSV